MNEVDILRNKVLKSSGFTIVELLIVIVIIAILAALIIVVYTGMQGRAYDSSRDSAVGTIKKTLELYRADHGEYPNVCGTVNVGCSGAGLSLHVVPTYINKVPGDPESGKRIDYVVNASQQGYGLLVYYSSKPTCKYYVGTGNPSGAGWWGASVPMC